MNIRARELNGRHIGQTITFTTGRPNARTTYTDKLTHVEHRRPNEELTAANILANRLVTVIHLQRTVWRTTGLFGATPDVGCEIDADEEIEIN